MVSIILVIPLLMAQAKANPSILHLPWENSHLSVQLFSLKLDDKKMMRLYAGLVREQMSIERMLFDLYY